MTDYPSRSPMIILWLLFFHRNVAGHRLLPNYNSNTTIPWSKWIAVKKRSPSQCWCVNFFQCSISTVPVVLTKAQKHGNDAKGTSLNPQSLTCQSSESFVGCLNVFFSMLLFHQVKFCVHRVACVALLVYFYYSFMPLAGTSPSPRGQNRPKPCPPSRIFSCDHTAP